MTTFSRPRRTGRAFGGLALAALLAAISTTPVRAAEPGPAGYGAPSAYGGTANAGARRVDLSIGRSMVIDLPRDAKEVFVANPGVANAVVRSTRKIFLIGMANGATSVYVMDAEGSQIAALEVNVGRDLSVLRQMLRQVLPNARIDVRPAGDSILLTGTVNAAGDASQAINIATAFVGQSGSDTGPSAGNSAGSGQQGGGKLSGQIINGLTIVGRDQVMLRVSVVEVNRSVLKQFGVSTSGSWSAVDATAAALLPGGSNVIASALGSTSGSSITAAGRSGNVGFGATLNALERAGLSRVLAEPTLVAVSGETATFTAGGEIPVLSSVVCSAATGGLSTGCVPSLAYKPYGVNLSFTPAVLSENRISMRVATEVTEVDPENGQTYISGFTVPAFRVRKTATSVELPSGGSMMTAGLIGQQSRQAISGLPGLINLPVLGALFRSRDYQRSETELSIIVTPYIAKPMEAAQVKRPDDGFVETSDPQTVLLGRLNRLYGVAGPSAPKAAPGGRYGFITD